MCGISGIYNPGREPVDPAAVRSMLAQIRYRGPDEAGIYTGTGVGLGSVRLSIIDLAQGQQPMSTADGAFWIVFNGEIFNYIELRRELEDLGYRFRTRSDTEVLLILYRHFRKGCLPKLNGQFAFAVWDVKQKELFLARDRMGIRPLFYSEQGGGFTFASEIKCLFASGRVKPSLDLQNLDRVFTFWSVPSPGTVFSGVHELPPGHWMIRRESGNETGSYWELDFRKQQEERAGMDFNEKLGRLEELLCDSVRLRLRSDVQVAAYLSGGLDSSATTYMIQKTEPGVLNTFSIGFEDAEFDETAFQDLVSKRMHTVHRSVTCRSGDIAEQFARVLWHTEVPLLRTGAVPMFLLSELVHDQGIKVVITGEGADEYLGGYNIFKEALVREFWSRQPESKFRPLLLQKLYPYLAQFQGRSGQMHRFFFGHRLEDTSSPVYSHLVRWNNSKHVRSHFTPMVNEQVMGDPVEAFMDTLPTGFGEWDLLSRAQWIESKLFLSGYLLSSQGDRMAMAHSVEGRYPFLDYRVVEFCAGLDERDKIRGLNEKYILKRMMKDILPPEVVARPKQAYRAPVSHSLLSASAPEYFREMLSPGQVRQYGLFRPETVEKLTSGIVPGRVVKETDQMALAGILSTQILVDQFISGNSPFIEQSLKVDCPVYGDQIRKNS